MIQLTKKMFKCTRILKKGATDTNILAGKWGCNFWTAQFRIKRLKELGVIETEILRDTLTGKFSGFTIVRINPYRLKVIGKQDD